jgi:hypothetical protein
MLSIRQGRPHTAVFYFGAVFRAQEAADSFGITLCAAVLLTDENFKPIGNYFRNS